MFIHHTWIGVIKDEELPIIACLFLMLDVKLLSIQLDILKLFLLFIWLPQKWSLTFIEDEPTIAFIEVSFSRKFKAKRRFSHRTYRCGDAFFQVHQFLSWRDVGRISLCQAVGEVQSSNSDVNSFAL